MDRADLVACATARARPELFGRHTVEHPVRRHSDLGVDRNRRRYLWGTGAGHYLADLEDDLARVERLSRGVCRADARATPTHGARVGVEELLPGELFDRGNSEALEFGFHEVRHCFHGALWALSVLEVHVERRCEDVAQHRHWQQDQETNEGENVGNPPALMPTSEGAVVLHEGGEWVTNERPLLVIGHVVEGNAEHLGTEAGNTDGEERTEDDGVFGLAFDANPVWAHCPRSITTQDRPHDRDGEDQSGEVTNHGITLVGATMEKLERSRHLVIDFEHGRHAQKHDEAEVHHRVHDSSAGLTHQGAHVHARPEVSEAGLYIFGSSCTIVWSAALPVLDAQ